MGEKEMTHEKHDTNAAVSDMVGDLRARGEAFVLATVVRTVAATAAKAGAKAVIRTDGSLSGGWIGGGCARGAVLKAAREALADGQPRLISVAPEDVLETRGLRPGETRDGVRYARNMCPSKGTMDIFVEPVLPRPELVICGTSPVALALAELAPRFGFAVTGCAPDAAPFPEGTHRVEGYAIEAGGNCALRRCVVVATQGNGDEAGLRAALASGADYVGFVGSRAKIAALRARLAASGMDDAAFGSMRAPAGLDIGAITPEEIALSILAEMVAYRRRGQRLPEQGPC